MLEAERDAAYASGYRDAYNERDGSLVDRRDLAGELQAVTMERNMLLQVIDAALKALGPGDDEDSDSPGNMAYAILMHGVNA